MKQMNVAIVGSFMLLFTTAMAQPSGTQKAERNVTSKAALMPSTQLKSQSIEKIDTGSAQLDKKNVNFELMTIPVDAHRLRNLEVIVHAYKSKRK